MIMLLVAVAVLIGLWLAIAKYRRVRRRDENFWRCVRVIEEARETRANGKDE
jgi:hypothetical protein